VNKGTSVSIVYNHCGPSLEKPHAMTEQPRSTDAAGSGREPGAQPASRLWRTEGLPDDRQPRRRIQWKIVAAFVALDLVLFAVLVFQERSSGPQAISYTEFKTEVGKRNVGETFARGNSIQGTLREPVASQARQGRPYRQFTTERPTFAVDDLLAELAANSAIVRATPIVNERGVLANLLISLAPLFVLFAVYYWIFRRHGSPIGGALFGRGARKPVNPDSIRATFADVAGIDEVEAEIGEVVDFLRDPARYRRLGARAPRGVLLAGAPGTGKTLLARATAGEAGVPFFSASASEFVEMIVGVGASRVRELFGEARKVAPAIVFIDEIDTIGRVRSGGPSMSGHNEREQTLNQILTEMDGFSGVEGIVVLAATNRADVLDPALLRPGRFDRTIMVHAPDQKGRAEILRVHTRSVPLTSDVDLDRIAASTPGMTGADLANLVNEAALLAARLRLDAVSQRELMQALEKVQLGAARSVVMPEYERRRTAYHEAGHALLGMLQPGADPVRKVSIVPRGRALGVTLSTPEIDRYGYDANYLRGRIVGALGGMAAEQEVFGVVTTGAESDLEAISRIARAMVGRWGMSDRVGRVSVLPADGDGRVPGVSEQTLYEVDGEVRRITDECYAEARRLLSKNREKLEAIVARLLDQETLDEAEVYAAAGIPRLAGAQAAGVQAADAQAAGVQAPPMPG
jgi:cell division protease FtsH